MSAPRFFLAFALTTLAVSPAFAGSCEKWKAGQDETEEGPTMLASVCAAGHPDDLLNISCGGEGKLRLAYVTSAGDDYPPDGNMEYKAKFEFAAGDQKAVVELGYEAMDGIMVASPSRNDPVFALLKGSGPVTLTDLTGHLPALSFGLAGSSAAIRMVENGCYD